MSRYPTKWLRRMRRLAENGYMKPPSLYTFIKSLPELSASTTRKSTQTTGNHSTSRLRIYPEDFYIQEVYEKHPEIKTEPIKLNSFSPPLSRRFAWRLLEVIKKGETHTHSEAFEQVEEEFRTELKQTQDKAQVAKSSSRIVQEEEERVLFRALRQHREREERRQRSSTNY